MQSYDIDDGVDENGVLIHLGGSLWKMQKTMLGGVVWKRRWVTCDSVQFIIWNKPTMSEHGAEPKYYHKVIGGNFRMDPIQACVLRIKLQRLEVWHGQRRQNAAHYNQLLGEAQLEEVVCPTAVYHDDNLFNHHIYNQYTVRVQRREDLRNFLQERGVATEIYYPVPFHRQECFADLGYRLGSLPESDRAAQEVLALPVYPGLTSEMQEYVVENLIEFYRS